MNTKREVTISFPDLDNIEQGNEYFILNRDNETEKIEFHDYNRIYEIPGLYEKLFYERYKCNSPITVCSLLEKYIGPEAREIKALDIGAGKRDGGRAALGAWGRHPPVLLCRGRGKDR